jgi:hypothetical protein
LRGPNLELVAFWAQGAHRAGLRTLAILAAPVIILTLLEPFDSGVLPFPLRLAYWAVLLGTMNLIFPWMVRLVRRLAEGRNVSAAAILVAACAVAALPLWGLVKALDWLLAAVVAPLFGVVAPLETPWSQGFTGFLTTYGAVFLVTALIVGVASLLKLTAQRTTPPTAATRPGVRFLSRLPAGVKGELVCIRMEDHYLRVVTRQGEALILMRMRDALGELQDYPGLQVHRSWWVAVDAIARLARTGRRLEVVLNTGVRAPVSSTYRAEVEGLIFGSDGAT